MRVVQAVRLYDARLSIIDMFYGNCRADAVEKSGEFSRTCLRSTNEMMTVKKAKSLVG